MLRRAHVLSHKKQGSAAGHGWAIEELLQEGAIPKRKPIIAAEPEKKKVSLKPKPKPEGATESVDGSVV